MSKMSKVTLITAISFVVAGVVIQLFSCGERAAALKDAKNVQLALASFEAENGTFPIGIYDGNVLSYVLTDPSGAPYLSAAGDREGWYRYSTGRSNGYEACLRYHHGTYCLMVTEQGITAISADSADMLEMMNAMDVFATSLRWMSKRYGVELPTSLTDIDYQTVGDEAHDFFKKEVDIFFEALEKYGYFFKEYYRSDFSDAPSTFHIVVRSGPDGTYLMTNNQGTGVCGKALTFAPPLD